MIYETYICSKSNNLLEYGFTFKAHKDMEDSLFDFVIGWTVATAANKITEKVENARWIADAICTAANQRGE